MGIAMQLNALKKTEKVEMANIRFTHVLQAEHKFFFHGCHYEYLRFIVSYHDPEYF